MVIEAHCGVKQVNPQLIPQFPLKKHYNKQSNKVDFLVVSRDRRQAFLVEVKTNMGSLRKGQVDCHTRASDKGLNRILSELREIAKASSGVSVAVGGGVAVGTLVALGVAVVTMAGLVAGVDREELEVTPVGIGGLRGAPGRGWQAT